MIYKIDGVKNIYVNDVVEPVTSTEIPYNNTNNPNVRKDLKKTIIKKDKLTDEEKDSLFKGLLSESINNIKEKEKNK